MQPQDAFDIKEYHRLQLQPQDPMDVQELTSVPYAKDRIIMMDSQELMSVPYAQDTSQVVIATCKTNGY